MSPRDGDADDDHTPHEEAPPVDPAAVAAALGGLTPDEMFEVKTLGAKIAAEFFTPPLLPMPGGTSAARRAGMSHSDAVFGEIEVHTSSSGGLFLPRLTLPFYPCALLVCTRFLF